MPTFDFRCKRCSTVFEFARPFGSKTSPSCPACGSKSTEKLLTPPAVHFKGGGWYKTDSRPAAKSAAPKPADSPSKPEAAPTKSGAPSAKPDAHVPAPEKKAKKKE